MAMNNWDNNPFGYDPFFDVRRIHNQVDDIFTGFFNDRQVGGRRDQGQGQGREQGQGQGQGQRQGRNATWLPVVDVKESDKAITIHAELPGMKKEDIHVDISDGVLTLSGEKKDAKKEENERYHRVERSYGKFARSFSLPKGVDPSLVSAAFTDGVLELTIPKPALKAAEKKKIEVK